MSLAVNTLNQILIIFTIILIGILCYKIKLIDEDTKKKLSDILLLLVNPIVIFVSYQRDFSSELMEGLLVSLLLSIVTHTVAIAVSYILIKKKKRKKIVISGTVINKWVDNDDVAVERTAGIYANVSFMGIPLVYGVFGSEGVFYVTASITIFNILLWTHGIIMMSGSKEMNFKSMLKKLLSPSIIAVVIGIVFYILQIRLPGTIDQALNYVADLNTPFAMLIAGVTIGKTNILNLLTKPRVYLVTFIKLLLVPLILVLVYSRFSLNNMVYIIAIIMAGAPSAATSILFSIKFEKNSVLAAEIFTMTTILSAITIPLVVTIAELFI